MVDRATPTQRFKVREEKAMVRFDTANGGSWNYLVGVPGGSAVATLVPLSEMSHDGRQVVRIDLTDDCTSAYVGVTTGKTFALPGDWSGEFCAAINIASGQGSLTNVNMYLNDVAFTNRYEKLMPMTVWKHHGWRTVRWRMFNSATNGGAQTGGDGRGTTGAPTPSTMNCARLRFLKTAGVGTACSIYVAFMGVPARARPQIMLTFDGATIGQYTNLFPVLQAKKVTASFAGQSDLNAGTAGTHMTAANILEMQSSGLAEFYVYSKTAGAAKGQVGSVAVSDVGLATYLANYDLATEYFKSIGVRNPTLFHPYPLGDYTDALMDGLIARGTKLARRADSAGYRTNESANVFNGKQMLSMDSTASIINTDTVASRLAYIDEAIMNGENAITLCHQVNPTGDYVSPGWAKDRWEQFIDALLLRQKQGLCDIVGAEVFINRLTNPRFS